MDDRFKFRAWMIRFWGEELPEKPSGVMNYFKLGDDLKPLGIDLGKDKIMQCTGLKDKNGKLIFEGDIVSFGLDVFNGNFDTLALEGIYQWCDECLGFEVKVIGGIDYKSWRSMQADERIGCLDYSNNIEEVEIIGNIYENPELLEDNNV